MRLRNSILMKRIDGEWVFVPHFQYSKHFILISQSGGKSTYLLSDGNSYLTSELLINEAVEMTYFGLETE